MTDVHNKATRSCNLNHILGKNTKPERLVRKFLFAERSRYIFECKNKNRMRLKSKNFECVKEDNSEEEDSRQWEVSKIVFDEFKKYLSSKNYKDELIERQLGYSSYFMMNYFFVYDDEMSILATDDTTIRTFLGNWYIRKNLSPNFKEMKEILSALFDFFEFICKKEFITVEQFEKIKQVCKDKDWFENRLKTYKTTDRNAFKEWIDEYNYDW
ncbi:MAG: hypothetical protein HQ522_22625 [Bacteroidetes bacterium]|nr:hypothetical protein [Bacteroidota bacterium]